MNPKLTSVISYLTIIGWFIAYFMHKNRPSQLSNVHLKNALGLHTLSFLMNVLAYFSGVGFILSLSFFVQLAILLLTIVGVVYAFMDKAHPLPIIGEFCQQKFPNF